MFTDMMRYGNDLPKGLDNRYSVLGHPMMWWADGGQGAFAVFSILWLITWVLLIIVLIALARWLWKKGDKGK